MSLSFLHLNPDKTENPSVGHDKFFSAVAHFIGPFYSNLLLRTLVTELDQSRFHQQRNIANIRCVLSSADLELLSHTSIFSRIDCCNSLYMCLSHAALNRLQVVQNAAARLLTRTSGQSHFTPSVLCSFCFLYNSEQTTRSC